MKVMRVVGFANGVPCPIVGQYLKEFNFDAHDGRGDGLFTTNPYKAMRFATLEDLFAFYRRASTVRPLREDGRPNRPLTATHMLVETLTGV